MHDDLDNPVWSAMNSFNSSMAHGTEHAKLFPEDVSPFAGLSSFNEDSFRQLYDLLPDRRAVGLVTPLDLNIPAYFKINRCPVVLQLLGENLQMPEDNNDGIISLDEQYVPQMLSLTALTNPGPFYKHTINFGNFTGIFKDSQLVAMAGQRMHLQHHVEISGVCTHPDHLGKGYGSRLIINQAYRIIKEGFTPFLHVMSDNESAIRIYQRLGFTKRKQINIYIIQKINNKS